MLLAFVVLRAARTALTYDEAASYLRYVSTDLLSTFSFAVATNHLLHSVLTRASHAVFGAGELALRLPTVCGYLLYLAACYLIVRRLQSRWLAFFGFLLLNLNPYLLEYFALSRGYGISIAFLMMAVYCLIEFVTHADAGEARSWLTWCLGLGVLAVLANFSTLNAYLGILAVTFIASTTRAGTGDASGHQPQERRQSGILRWTAVPVALLMSLLVFSQDAQLSKALYAPVAVRVGGLAGADLDRVTVAGVTIRGRMEPFRRDADTWRSQGTAFTGLRIDVDRSIAQAVERIDVTLGTRPFSHPGGRAELWNVTDGGRHRTWTSLESLSLTRPWTPGLQSIVNWGGDALYVRAVTLHALVVAVGVLMLLVLGGAAVRLTTPRAAPEGRLFVSALAWTAALVAAPLYVLQRNGELYYGGSDGFIADSLQSVVDGTLYGRALSLDRTTVATGVLLALLLLTVALVATCRLMRSWTPLVRAAVPLGVLLTASVASIVQHALFETPYPHGRTALLYLPIGVLSFVLLLDGLAQPGLRRTVCVVAAGVATGFAAVHLSATAQWQFVSDWRADAATSLVIADVAADARRRGLGDVALGVDADFYPVARYYALRITQPAIRVAVAPTSPAMDYFYIHHSTRAPWMAVLSSYRDGRSVLARTRPD